MIVEQTLINEIELGEQLNHCVQQSRRSDFSLMLAMLTDNACEFSEFLLPEAQQPEIVDINSDILRKKFDLPEPQKLALSSNEDINEFNQGELIEADRLISLRLENALNPKALAYRDDKQHIPSNVLDNTSLHVQSRQQQKPVDKKLAFNANEWLKGVQQAVVSEPIARA